ncbi:VIT1/CCC1 transporter family protein [Tichowtungia aerotolerans]|uniref:Rubrerythrin family protein n=1 Tax=Tichowtungia aerotolerans TaxID=2697043 RepID=A0A6P1MBV1_9BACT|nr:VIT1/CCC1 transporter family protein [Tichowtungia aerotolerans]QHI68575.1 rubrerythrin family protein [Tichowtungia aerotolerans]
MNISESDKRQFRSFQRDEITEYHIYRRLAQKTKNEANRRILLQIAEDELRHYNEWKTVTETDVRPNSSKVRKYAWITRLLGLTFGVKLMEAGEAGAQQNYSEYEAVFAPAGQMAAEENDHEQELINLLDEERLQYTGSVVLGLNDALVELTGALAGLTLALRDTGLIALTGSITGIAAAFSMAASEYLSTKSEDTEKHPAKASVYTGVAYIFTVIILIIPYLIFQNYFVCLGVTLALGIGIIAAFNYYISVAKDLNFRKRFIEMTGLSLGVAAISFLIGFLLRHFTGIEI